MKKNYLTAAVLVAMTCSFAACLNEDLDSLETLQSEKGESVRLVFNIKTGASVAMSRVGGEDQAIKKLTTIFFDEKGNPVSGLTKEYVGESVIGEKLSVSVPVDQKGKILTGYLVANLDGIINVPNKDALELVLAQTPISDVAKRGIPMSTGLLSVDTSAPVVEVDATMKRAMSMLAVVMAKDAAAGVTPSDFAFKVKKAHVESGYLLQDQVASVSKPTAELIWSPKASGLLGYFYQSSEIEIEVIPTKVGLATGSRTVVIPAEKAKMRNRKYQLSLKPLKIEVPGKTDFTVTVEEWDTTEAPSELDWTKEIVASAAHFNMDNLPGANFKVVGDTLTLLYPEFRTHHIGQPLSWFTAPPGWTLEDVNLSSLKKNGKGSDFNRSTGVYSANPASVSLNDINTTAVVTIAKGAETKSQIFNISVEGMTVDWNPNLKSSSGAFSMRVRPTKRGLSLVDLHTVSPPKITKSTSEFFMLATGWRVINVEASQKGTEAVQWKLFSQSDRRELEWAGLKTLVAFRDGNLSLEENYNVEADGSVGAYGELLVTLQKGDQVRKRRLLVYMD